jgi:hypothetical protein
VNSYAKTQNGSCRRTELAGKFISSTLKIKREPVISQKERHTPNEKFTGGKFNMAADE